MFLAQLHGIINKLCSMQERSINANNSMIIVIFFLLPHSLCTTICVYFISIVLSKCVVSTVLNGSDVIHDICYVLVGLK